MDTENVAPKSQAKCLYRKLDNGIHEIVLLDFSRAGVDAFVDTFVAMCESLQPGESAPLLVDGQRGSQPVKYTIDRMRRLNIPTAVKHSRVAVLREENVINNMVSAMMSYFPRTPVRFFTPKERDSAVEWLMKK